MSNFSLSEKEMKYISVFEEVTDAVAHDCIYDEDYGKVIFVVKEGDMAIAIGKNGSVIEKVEEELGRGVELIEDSEVVENFVANAFQPAAVNDVIIEEDGSKAVVEVPDNDKGLAIGENGRNVEKVKKLVERHHGIEEVVVE